MLCLGHDTALITLVPEHLSSEALAEYSHSVVKLNLFQGGVSSDHIT